MAAARQATPRQELRQTLSRLLVAHRWTWYVGTGAFEFLVDTGGVDTHGFTGRKTRYRLGCTYLT